MHRRRREPGKGTPMKRFFALLAVFCMLGLLAGCAAGADDAGPAWQTELDDGSAISISGCTVSEETVQFRYFFDRKECFDRQLLHLTGKAAPTVTLTGVEESAVTLLFVEYADDGIWQTYTPRAPVEKLDYVLTRGEDGTLQYRLDTVYSYGLAIGYKLWLLDVTREGL